MKDLRAALAAGEAVFGTNAVTGHPSVIELLGWVGFDYVFIDTEQAATSPSGRELEHLVRAAYAADITPIVRPAWNFPHHINQALNCGAKGVWIPHIDTVEEARLAVSYSRYPPEGKRGAAPVVRAARHGLEDWDAYRERANRETLVILIIESMKAIENVYDIAAVPGVDMLAFGLFDLAVDMGIPQKDHYGNAEAEWVHPDLEAAARVCLDACKANGLYGTNVGWNIESAKRFVEMGYQVILLGTDISLLLPSVKALWTEVEALKATVNGAREGLVLEARS
jgi:4-hydroxy-2-oxoheptanedioate aldolase